VIEAYLKVDKGIPKWMSFVMYSVVTIFLTCPRKGHFYLFFMQLKFFFVAV
jgi:hypothetical protein